METCDHCDKKWDCSSPCLEVLAWQEIQGRQYRIPNKEYKPKGIAPLTSPTDRLRRKSNWDALDNPNLSGDSEYINE